MTTTAIQFASDFQVTAALLKVTACDRIAIACKILGKNIESYAHLDNGRKGMTGANLLRGAARKDDTIVGKVQDAVAEVAATYPEGFDPIRATPRKKSTKKAAPATPAIEWPKSKRFAFAELEGGEWKFYYKARTANAVTRPEGV